VDWKANPLILGCNGLIDGEVIHNDQPAARS
jgi:hypothetical protein